MCGRPENSPPGLNWNCLHGSEEGEDVISAETVGGRMEMGVRDEGSSLNRKVLSKMFAPFFSTKEGEKRGSRLGVSIVCNIIRDHDGTIGVDGTPAYGTVFTIMLLPGEET